MASYAELNEDNVVLRIVKISNDIMLDSFNNEQEGLGLAECQKIFGGGTWIQCSASGAFRRRFPSIGSVYTFLLYHTLMMVIIIDGIKKIMNGLI